MRTFWYQNFGDCKWHLAYDDKDDFPEKSYYCVGDFAVWNAPLTKMELAKLKDGCRPDRVNRKKLKKWNALDSIFFR